MNFGKGKKYRLYIAGKKLLPVTILWKGQRMRVLYKRYGVSTDRGNNVILLMIRETEPKIYRVKKAQWHMLSVGVLRLGWEERQKS